MKKYVKKIILPLILLLCLGTVQAQVDKGVTSTGKEVDCSTIDPSVDKTVSEYGKIVTRPRVTRNGKLITDDCGCPVSIDCTNCTDTVNCISITMSAPILSGDVTSAVLQIFSDAGYTTQVGSDITAIVDDGKITATAANLSCYTKYYLRLILNNNSNCTFDWTDSTRDMTMEKVTTCEVLNELTNEHSVTTGTIDSVYDHEGNAYAVVQIGNQCWLKENMRAVTSPSTGTYFIKPSPEVKTYSGKTGRWSLFDSTMAVSRHYGVLYNWNATMDIYNTLKGELDVSSENADAVSLTASTPHRGICPQGWHVPTEGEYLTMETTALELQESHPTPDPALETQNKFRAANTALASIIAGGCYWCSSTKENAPGYFNNSLRNASGFSAYPAEADKLTECGGAHFWTSTQYGTTQAGCANIYHNVEGVNWYIRDPKTYCLSVRCVRDVIITDTITFDANNGDGVMPQQIVERGAKVALDSNEFTRVGTYDFIGWNTQRNGYGTAYADADSIVTNGNVTLYAQWHTYCSGNIRSNEAGSTRIDSVHDVDNNWYKVIEIGTQCWLAENMRVTHGKNTGAITQANTNTESATQPYYYDYTSSDLTLRERGLLYNWSAAVDSTFDAPSSESYTNRQGICPDGWHLPSDQEWFVMEKNTLIDTGGIWDTVTLAENSGTLEQRDAYISGAGRWTTGDENAWMSDTHPTSPGNFLYSERNMIGLNVIPTGDYKPISHPEHGLTDDGIGANFWTSTTSSQGPGYAMGRDVDNFREAVLRHYYEKEFGRSVRCIRDLPLIPEMSVCEDTTFGNITLSNVKNAAKIEFIQNGTTVKTVNNPATEIIVSDLAEGNYKIKATSSTEDTLVDNARVKHTYTHCTVGTLRANEMGATTTQLDSVRDHQNNWYEVVQIGNQCWLKENMRATTTPSGTNILLGGLDQFVQNNHSKAAFTHSNSVYGIMYNWCAAVDTFNNSGSKPEVAAVAETGSWTCNLPAGNRRGICPEGWHIPSDGEFWELEKNTLTGLTPEDSATKNYGTARSGIGAGRLAAGCEWYPDTKPTSPGNYSYAERNLSGFSARPAGTIEDGSQYANLTLAAYFWSSTPYLNTGAFARVVRTNNVCTQRGSNHRYNAFSVRCVRDVVECTTPTLSICTDRFGATLNDTIEGTIDWGDGSATVTNPVAGTMHYYDAAGDYTVTLTVEGGCSASVDVTSEGFTGKACNVSTKGANETYKDGSTTQIVSVEDHEGNSYRVVQIGSQCWLAENMRAVTRPNGDTILQRPPLASSTTLLMAYIYDNSEAYFNKYGVLYNWAAAMDSLFTYSPFIEEGGDFLNHRGICPEGWHLPTDDEWKILESEYMEPAAPDTEFDVDGIGTFRGIGAGKYTGGCEFDWEGTGNTTTPNSYSYADRNITGFSALPASNYFGGEEGFKTVGLDTYFWTATSHSNGDAWWRDFAYNQEGIGRAPNTKAYGYPVRCVRDVEIIPTLSICEDTTFGTVTVKEIQNTEKIEFIQNGSVKKTVNNPDTEVFVGDLAEGNYTVKATSASGGTYEDNAYVKHTYTHCTGIAHAGTNLGNGKFANKEWSSVTNQIDSVSDHEGNVYEVVQIGDQCWLKENMRATTSPSTGSTILMDMVQSNSAKSAGFYNNDEAKYGRYGVLYNWCAAVDTFYAGNGRAELANAAGHISQNWDVTIPDNRRGICPLGWHIPSDEDWNTLENAVVPNAGSTSSTGFQGSGTDLAPMLSTGCDWKGDSENGKQPNSYSNTLRNSSGFSALPAGVYNGTATGYSLIGEYAYGWCSKPNRTDVAYYRALIYSYEGMFRGDLNPRYVGMPVRCVRDVVIPEFSLCEDTTFGTVTLREIQNAEKIEFVQNGMVKKTFNDPAEEIFVNDLTQGNYTVRAFSTTGNTYEENTYIKHTYTHCTVNNLLDNEMGNGIRLDSVRDHQNNWYEVVQIGNQCWLKENMRATTEPTAPTTSILQNPASTNTDVEQRAYYYENSTIYSERFGCLYNYLAAMNFSNRSTAFTNPHRGICPEGWHLPTDDEWFTLEKGTLTNPAWTDGTVASTSGLDYRGTGAGRLAAGCDWTNTNSSTTPNSYSYDERNITGFSVFPSGKYESGVFTAFGTYAIFWSTTYGFGNSSSLFYRGFGRSIEGVERGNGGNPTSGFAVRCVRDVQYTMSAAADTATCSSIKVSATTTGLSAITSATACAYTTANCSDASPICADNADIQISGNAITATVNGLNCNTRYYVKITATDGTHTVEDLVSDTTFDRMLTMHTTCTVTAARTLDGTSDLSHEHLAEGTTDQIDSVYDHQGNAYAVVQIDNQCWLKENMRCTTSPRQGTINLTSGPSWFIGDNPFYFQNPFYYASSDVPLYGYLYNYCATIDTAYSAAAMVLPAGPRRGICPKGWHVPSEAEWVVLDNKYATNPSSEWARGDYAAKVTTCQYWPATGTIGAPLTAETNAPGDPYAADHNISGLSILPAGGFVSTGLNTPGLTAYLWTATPGTTFWKSYARTLYFFDKNMYGSGDVNACDGHSVRCVRDVEIIPTLSICEDNFLGEIKLADVENAAKVEVINGSNAVVAIDNAPAAGNTFTGLASGTYTVKATSTSGSIATETANLVKEYTHCTVNSLLTNEMGENTRLDSVRDHQNNWYEVVQIGNYCWLKENMRCTQTNTGVNLTNKTGTSDKSTTEKYYYVSDKADKYGYLYNYPAANSICPSGWHLPSDAEWKNMVEAAGVTDNNTTTGSGLGKLVTSCDWQSVTGGPTDPKPGNYEYTERNISGFSALPAGEWNGDFYVISNAAEFWTATKSGSDGWYRAIGYADNGTHRYTYQLHRAYSVRCVRNN